MTMTKNYRINLVIKTSNENYIFCFCSKLYLLLQFGLVNGVPFFALLDTFIGFSIVKEYRSIYRKQDWELCKRRLDEYQNFNCYDFLVGKMSISSGFKKRRKN